MNVIKASLATTVLILMSLVPISSLAQVHRNSPVIQTSAKPEETVFKGVAPRQYQTEQQRQLTAQANQHKTNSLPFGLSYLALKTNVPLLAVGIENLAVEMDIRKQMTLDIPVMWSLWDMSQKHGIRILAIQPEVRWWTTKTGEGHFFGLHAHAGLYNVKWNDYRYQSTGRPLWGLGVSYGYKVNLTRHLGVDLTIGVGYSNMKYNRYYNIENGAQIDVRSTSYFGLSRAGASLVYQF